MERGIKTFQPGETVIREGARGTSAFIILSGAAEVFRGSKEKEILLATLGRGQVFGEMGLINDQPRAASIRALTEIKVMSVSRDRFNDLLIENPFILVPIMRGLFEKLRQVNEVLAGKSETIDGALYEDKAFDVVMEGQTMEAKEALAKTRLQITKFPFLIGRASRNRDTDVFCLNDLFVKEEKPYLVSRNQMAIDNIKGAIWVIDRGSAFGTIVNGREIGRKGGVTRVRLDDEENQIVLGPVNSKYIFLLRVIPRQYPPWRNPQIDLSHTREES
ncbi:MAG: cyclic nucleotide-binding domain-containing protein [Proteobacteria bacterium]|nr:cyclic nucleotide-binding domain-containing protein [Pseudomonadota bacterium]